MNNQPTEPRVTDSDGQYLDVHSIFYTIQGEGPFSGERATFVRLAGCNLQCPGCDTEYTQARQTLSIDNILMRVVMADKGKGSLVVITGGEPLRQPIGWLVDILLMTGRTVQIESNGSLPPDSLLYRLLFARMTARNLGGVDRLELVVSPKTVSIHPQCLALATAFKYVLDHQFFDADDGLPTLALGHERGKGVARPREGSPVYLTPFDSGNEGQNRFNLLAVGKSCLKHGYRAGVQLHKYLELA